jgi:hypothetical protein
MESFQNLIVNETGWFIFIFLVLLGILILIGLIYYGFSAPPTEEEKKKWHPGDDLLGGETSRMRGTLAVTVNASCKKIWPYLAQLGQRRAGLRLRLAGTTLWFPYS